jgi:hypothetical protein
MRALEEAGAADLVEFHEEESQVLLPGLVAEGRRFDLAFVDGSHRFERVLLDLLYSRAARAPGRDRLRGRRAGRVGRPRARRLHGNPRLAGRSGR